MNDTLCFKSPYKITCQLQIGYKQIYKASNNKNNFLYIKCFEKTNGLYFFVSCQGEMLYVGKSNSQRLCSRVSQHFKDNDTGGLRYKLRGNRDLLEELNNSVLYIFPHSNQEEVSKAEEALIKLYQPKLNNYLK